MLIIVLGSFFAAAPLFSAVPAEKAQQAKTAACKCDPCTCQKCTCTNADACKSKVTQKQEHAALVEAAITSQSCSSETKSK